MSHQNEGYEVDNPEIKSRMRSIGDKLKAALPSDWGFMLMLFSYGERGQLFYTSSGERDGVIKAILEWLGKQGVTVPDGHEINPHHPMTKAAQGNWHKIVALLLMKYADQEQHIITSAEL